MGKGGEMEEGGRGTEKDSERDGGTEAITVNLKNWSTFYSSKIHEFINLFINLSEEEQGVGT
jgi:hypothetical protein